MKFLSLDGLTRFKEKLIAATIPYTNTSSGLAAENVQDAVDELNSNMNSMFKKYTLDAVSYTVASNATVTVNLDYINGETIEEGYKILCLAGYDIVYGGDNSVCISRVIVYDRGLSFKIRNVGTTSVTRSVSATVIVIPENYLS